MNRHRFLAFAVACVLSGAAAAQPDYPRIELALGKVIVRGIDESRGNAEVATNGTGFFIGKQGVLLTAYHLRSQLGSGVHGDSITYWVTPKKYPAVSLPATVLEANPQNDYMVLFVDIGDYPDIGVLARASFTQARLNRGSTVYTIGYPQGAGLSTFSGTLSSLSGHPGPPPLPRWLLSMTLMPGQSGSPILAADGRAVAIAVQSETSIGAVSKATPLMVVAQQWFEADEALGATTFDAVQNAPTVVATATLAAKPRQRQRTLNFINPTCDGQQTAQHEETIAPEVGWSIDANSLRLVPRIQIGNVFGPRVSVDGNGAIIVSAQLTDPDRCVRIPATVDTPAKTIGDLPAQYQASLTYTELPQEVATTATILTEVRAVPGINSQVGVWAASNSSVSWGIVEKGGSRTAPPAAVTELRRPFGDDRASTFVVHVPKEKSS